MDRRSRLPESAGAQAARDEADTGPLWARIARDLAAAIERGEHAPGATLPAAAEIAAAYRVNRHTVRQALRHLQDLGLVSVEPGRGTTVRNSRFPYRLGRRVSFRANFAAAGVDAAGEIVDCSTAAASDEAAHTLRIAAGAPVWHVRSISRAAGVPVSTSVHTLSADRFPGLDRRLARARASFTAAFREYGIEDYVRLSTRLTARAPTRLEARLLGLRRGVPVLQSSAVDGLEGGDPLQVVVAAFAGDRVEMVLEGG